MEKVSALVRKGRVVLVGRLSAISGPAREGGDLGQASRASLMFVHAAR